MKASAFFICEKSVQNADGKINLFGAGIEKIHVRPPFKKEVHFFIRLEPDPQDTGTHRIEVIGKDEDQSKAGAIRANIKMPPDEYINARLFGKINFPSGGIYRFWLFVDEKELGSTSINVVRTEAPQ